MLRGKMTDEAWRRRGLGRKLVEAEAKGRVDDILAGHVGISRPTLRKICAMSKAAKENPERYGAIVEEMDRDGKVDRHHKEYLTELAKDNPNPRFKAIVLTPTWQNLEAKSLRRAVGAADLMNTPNDSAILLIPSSIPSWPSQQPRHPRQVLLVHDARRSRDRIRAPVAPRHLWRIFATGSRP